MKKGTKLTDNPKDYMLRTRMDKETVKMLDYICEEYSISRSESVRRLVENQYFLLRGEL